MMRRLIFLFALAVSGTSTAQTLKVCLPEQGTCGFYVQKPFNGTFVTADLQEFKDAKLHSQIFPINLVSSNDMDSINQGPVQQVDFNNADLDKLGDEVDKAHSSCVTAASLCSIAGVATVASWLKEGPVGGLIPLAAAAFTCKETVSQCTIYWDKYAEYEKLDVSMRSKTRVGMNRIGGEFQPPIPGERPGMPGHGGGGPGGNCVMLRGGEISDGTTRWPVKPALSCTQGG